MGLFGFGKKGKVIDLSQKYNEEKALNETKVQPAIDINATMDNPAASGSFLIDANESVEERRRKLTNRIMEMSAKMDELSNQIFLLQQRMEVLEMRSRAEETPKQETQNNSG